METEISKESGGDERRGDGGVDRGEAETAARGESLHLGMHIRYGAVGMGDNGVLQVLD